MKRMTMEELHWANNTLANNSASEEDRNKAIEMFDTMKLPEDIEESLSELASEDNDDLFYGDNYDEGEIVE